MASVCSSCAATVPDGAKFCGECGTPVAVRCGRCGAPAAQPEQRFCLECGSPLAAGAGGGSPALEAAGPGAEDFSRVERRQVSVLFADLTGFTSFSEGRDAEDVRDMLSEYFDMSRRTVESYGGHVEKFIGDAVMALWGAPVANEDDAERAVRAGLDLVGGVKALGDRLGLALRLRVGILTGEAAVELDAVAEGMVIGDAINTASRIQSVAEPGSVLVDDITRSVADRAIAYEDAGSHVLKGKSQPVHTWRALRVIAAVGGVGRADLELPLVGRTREMGEIKGCFDALIASRTGLQLLIVVGEPGLGKSRLAWELRKYADGVAATVLWHYGQALSFGQGAGLSSLADMVRARAEIEVGEPAADQVLKLERLVHDLFAGSDPETVDRVLLGLRRLLGLDDGGQRLDRGELFSSWRLLFEQLAERDPVVMLFEDLQWADQGLLDFIQHLREWASHARILILVFSRPDERLDALTDDGERLDLRPLRGEDIETLVDAAVDGAPPGLLDKVREHAAGVPLFAVESLRMLAARGVMVSEGDAQRYRVVGELHDLDVPPSIHALIAARLDRLGELERRVLRGGAILGQRFAVPAAAALAGVSAADASSLLDGLVAKQFLAIDTDPRSRARGTHAFVHRQVQRVVLGTLSKRERKARHLAAAEYLSAQWTDPDRAAILAGHLLAALEAHPTAPDAGEIRHRALGLTLEAARRAEEVGALDEAIALFARAAEIEWDERRRAEHLVQAARCAERYGKQEARAAGNYAAARELHEQAGRRREALRLRARELYVYQWSRPSSELIDPLREVYEALEDERDAAFADAAALLANALYADGAAEPAERIAAEAIAAAEQARAYDELGMALNCRACALIELARPVEAVELFEAALEIRERHSPSAVPSSLGNIAITLAALGRFEAAVTAGQKAMAAAERLATRVNRNLAALHLARALFSLGQWDEALALVNEVAPETDMAYRGMIIGPPVLVALHRGEPERAQAVIEEFDREQNGQEGAFESDYRRLREVAIAHVCGAHQDARGVIERAQRGDYAEWPTWLPVAVDLIVQLQDDQALREAASALRRDGVPRTSPMVVAQSARLDALLAFGSRNRRDAASSWSAAIEVAVQAGMSFDAAALKLELFEHFPDHEGAVEGLHSATATFTRLGAAPWLTRALEAKRTTGNRQNGAPLERAAG